MDLKKMFTSKYVYISFIPMSFSKCAGECSLHAWGLEQACTQEEAPAQGLRSAAPSPTSKFYSGPPYNRPGLLMWLLSCGQFEPEAILTQLFWCCGKFLAFFSKHQLLKFFSFQICQMSRTTGTGAPVHEKVGGLAELDLGSELSALTPKACSRKEGTDLLHSSGKLLRMTLKRWRRVKDWKNIFARNASAKRLLSSIYQEVLKLNKEKPDFKKVVRPEHLSRHLLEDLQVANGLMRRCSRPEMTREVQMEMWLRYYCAPVRMAQIREHQWQLAWSHRLFCSLLAARQKGPATLDVVGKILTKLTQWS